MCCLGEGGGGGEGGGDGGGGDGGGGGCSLHDYVEPEKRRKLFLNIVWILLANILVVNILAVFIEEGSDRFLEWTCDLLSQSRGQDNSPVILFI